MQNNGNIWLLSGHCRHNLALSSGLSAGVMAPCLTIAKSKLQGIVTILTVTSESNLCAVWPSAEFDHPKTTTTRRSTTIRAWKGRCGIRFTRLCSCCSGGHAQQKICRPHSHSQVSGWSCICFWQSRLILLGWVPMGHCRACRAVKLEWLYLVMRIHIYSIFAAEENKSQRHTYWNKARLTQVSGFWQHLQGLYLCKNELNYLWLLVQTAHSLLCGLRSCSCRLRRFCLSLWGSVLGFVGCS